jgi:hypothetical protein
MKLTSANIALPPGKADVIYFDDDLTASAFGCGEAATARSSGTGSRNTARPVGSGGCSSARPRP